MKKIASFMPTHLRLMYYLNFGVTALDWEKFDSEALKLCSELERNCMSFSSQVSKQNVLRALTIYMMCQD